MARGVNKVILVGHLGADPEIRTTTSGKSVANLRIATTERRKQGDRHERLAIHRGLQLNSRRRTSSARLPKREVLTFRQATAYLLTGGLTGGTTPAAASEA